MRVLTDVRVVVRDALDEEGESRRVLGVSEAAHQREDHVGARLDLKHLEGEREGTRFVGVAMERAKGCAPNG